MVFNFKLPVMRKNQLTVFLIERLNLQAGQVLAMLRLALLAPRIPSVVKQCQMHNTQLSILSDSEVLKTSSTAKKKTPTRVDGDLLKFKLRLCKNAMPVCLWFNHVHQVY